MVPVHILVVDITSQNGDISFEKFQEQIAPCLAHLEALKGSFEKNPCSISYYPLDGQHSAPGQEYSVRAVVMISVGKQRAEHLVVLYQSIVRLIELELPDCDVQATINKFQFS